MVRCERRKQEDGEMGENQESYRDAWDVYKLRDKINIRVY